LRTRRLHDGNAEDRDAGERRSKGERRVKLSLA
jgi:hypothetical protein